MKRKMPRHIVLPNGMWRFIKGGSSGGKSRRKTRGVRMGRRGYRRSRGGGGSFGGKGILRVGGFLGAAILGIGAAAVAKRFVGAPLGTFTGAATGFLVGGVPGAVGGWVHDNIGNIGGPASAGGAAPVYGV